MRRGCTQVQCIGDARRCMCTAYKKALLRRSAVPTGSCHLPPHCRWHLWVIRDPLWLLLAAAPCLALATALPHCRQCQRCLRELPQLPPPRSHCRHAPAAVGGTSCSSLWRYCPQPPYLPPTGNLYTLMWGHRALNLSLAPPTHSHNSLSLLCVQKSMRSLSVTHTGKHSTSKDKVIGMALKCGCFTSGLKQHMCSGLNWGSPRVSLKLTSRDQFSQKKSLYII